MAGSTTNTITIDPQNFGFPAYLDFSTMRTNAINYLGPITGSYWTDYNVHDPGITTLEVLLYAIVDLGYRTHLPFGSLLAGPAGPDGPTMVPADFYTAGQVFGNNPVTVLDYRKLLMDLEEVRNAWLDPLQAGPTQYNGLYQIFLELAKDRRDFGDDKLWVDYQADVLRAVRRLMRMHRNLCEDVDDIVVLKKRDIVVKADLEIDSNTTVAAVYQAVAEALYTFFSPVPPFYSLGQLTAQGISLDTIFRGRSYTPGPSHGFLLDKDMPARSGSDKEIRLADVYNAVLAVTGITNIRKLSLEDAQGNPIGLLDNEWKIRISDDHIPAFLLAASSFRWYLNGQLLTTDLSGYNTAIERNARYSNKVLYPKNSPALDIGAPVSMTLPGLDRYRSIQLDYPQVYGIGPGGLPSDASTLRQSQALQFKGFLLFFDQLLADYVAQLANLKSLFSISAPATGGSGGSGGSTYFHGDLSSVPELTQLLRFPPPADGTVDGTVLVNPVSLTAFNQLIAAATAPDGCGPLSSANVDALPAYQFASASARDTALATTIVLFTGDPPAVETTQQDDSRWRYYFTKVDPDYLLMSRSSFTTQADAQGEAATVLYIGQNAVNYASISLGEVSQYSFSLTASSQSYYDYLQNILEDKSRYTQRRSLFLQHLLARFGEAFTDYALLQAGFASPDQIAQGQINGMQNFLSQWPTLSGGRGQAGEPGQVNSTEQRSVLKQRIYAYAGIPEYRNSIYCHFEVYRGEEWFHLAIRHAGEVLLTCPEEFTAKEAGSALRGLVAALADRTAWRVSYDEHTSDYGLEVAFYGRYSAHSTSRWAEKRAAERAAEAGFRMFQREPLKEDIMETSFDCRPRLLDDARHVIRVGPDAYPNKLLAEEAGYFWLSPDEFHRNRYPGLSTRELIAIRGFTPFTQQDVVGEGKEDRWSFEVLDEGHHFRFRSTDDYETSEEAQEAAFQLLHFLCEPRFYSRDGGPGDLLVVIRVDGVDWAEGEPRWEDEIEAGKWVDEIVRRMRRHRFHLDVHCDPIRWRWLSYHAMPDGEWAPVESVDDYTSLEAATAAARKYYRPREVPAEDQRLIPAESSKEGVWLYRLVDKEHPRAFHPFGRPTRHEAEALREELIGRGRHGYRYLQICLGGDNVRLQPAQGSTPEAYRFLIRCRNDYFSRLGVTGPDRELVLFESQQQFPSADAAQDAFQQKYFQLLDLACDPDNYGEGRPIRVAGAEGGDHPPELIVPAHTRDALIEAGLEVVPTLMEAVWTYPFRDEAPRQQGPREEAFRDEVDPSPHYRFFLGSGGEPDWESAQAYATPGEAQEAFNDFLLFLDYPGNYFIDTDWHRCQYRVGIREVLLESRHRFKDEEHAWGKEGVERCVDAAQTTGGFQLFRRSDCSYSFDVAFPNPHAIHPCIYNNAAHRDQALGALRQHPGYFLADGWITEPVPDLPGEHRFMLRNGQGHPVAWVPMPEHPSGDTIINRILEIVAAIDRGAKPQPFGSGWQLIVGESPRAFAIEPVFEPAFDPMIEPVSGEHRDSWERRLNDVADYFPITRDEPLPGSLDPVRYLLSVHLPAFTDPAVPPYTAKDCGCPPTPDGGSLCYAAWVGRESFASAWDAWKAWLHLRPVLADQRNYRPVFGDEVGHYGIELQTPDRLVAINPQHYPYARIDVEAMERAKARINAEGLHVIEHLLLRHRYKQDDDKDVYSFIITVALPAWSARFRTPANRVLLESIIQRETPAHILPRILWLTPGDMCRLEWFYGGWVDHLRRTAEDDQPCYHLDFEEHRFREFLFGLSDTDPDAKWLHEINEEFGWGDEALDEAESEPARERVEPSAAMIEAVFIVAEPKEIKPEPEVAEPEVTDPEEIESEQVAAEETAPEEAVREEAAPEEASPLSRDQSLHIRHIRTTRLARYHKKIETWLEATHQSAVADQVKSFISNPKQSMQLLKTLLPVITVNEHSLAATIIHNFLDRTVEKPLTKKTWKHIADVLGLYGRHLGTADDFYMTWQAEELMLIAPNLDLLQLKKLFHEHIHTP